eukprot:2280386-Prymnesium_polylepis.1
MGGFLNGAPRLYPLHHGALRIFEHLECPSPGRSSLYTLCLIDDCACGREARRRRRAASARRRR